MSMDDKFAILMVCRANICRSPIAELMLERRLGDRSQVKVSSAGTRACSGEGMPTKLAGLLAERDFGEWTSRSRQLTAEMIGESEIVLTMTRRQRAVVVERLPHAVRRTFTLREFVRLAESARAVTYPVSDMRVSVTPVQVLEDVQAYRGMTDSDFADDDIADPTRFSSRAFLKTMSRVAESVDDLAFILGLVQHEFADEMAPQSARSRLLQAQA